MAAYVVSILDYVSQMNNMMNIAVADHDVKRDYSAHHRLGRKDGGGSFDTDEMTDQCYKYE